MDTTRVSDDQVAAAAEVAPTTLYRLFGSKDGLVGAYVERADRRLNGTTKCRHSGSQSSRPGEKAPAVTPRDG